MSRACGEFLIPSQGFNRAFRLSCVPRLDQVWSSYVGMTRVDFSSLMLDFVRFVVWNLPYSHACDNDFCWDNDSTLLWEKYVQCGMTRVSEHSRENVCIYIYGHTPKVFSTPILILSSTFTTSWNWAVAAIISSKTSMMSINQPYQATSSSNVTQGMLHSILLWSILYWCYCLNRSAIIRTNHWPLHVLWLARHCSQFYVTTDRANLRYTSTHQCPASNLTYWMRCRHFTHDQSIPLPQFLHELVSPWGYSPHHPTILLRWR